MLEYYGHVHIIIMCMNIVHACAIHIGTCDTPTHTHTHTQAHTTCDNLCLSDTMGLSSWLLFFVYSTL